MKLSICDVIVSQKGFNGDGEQYTPLYEKGIKEMQNKPMETTLIWLMCVIKQQIIYPADQPRKKVSDWK